MTVAWVGVRVEKFTSHCPAAGLKADATSWDPLELDEELMR